jgi:Tfp pilus assembly protein PilF
MSSKHSQKKRSRSARPQIGHVPATISVELTSEKRAREAAERKLKLLAVQLRAYDLRADLAYQAGKCWFDIGDFKTAEHYLRLAVKKDRTQIAARLLLARLEMMHDDFDAAMDLYESILGNASDRLSQLQKEEMDDIMKYAASQDIERAIEKWPLISNELQLHTISIVKDVKKS